MPAEKNTRSRRIKIYSRSPRSTVGVQTSRGRSGARPAPPITALTSSGNPQTPRGQQHPSPAPRRQQHPSPAAAGNSPMTPPQHPVDLVHPSWHPVGDSTPPWHPAGNSTRCTLPGSLTVSHQQWPLSVPSSTQPIHSTTPRGCRPHNTHTSPPLANKHADLTDYSVQLI